MAKQSGLHQIRGKVGEHSYYKQTGVAAGLIRSINQGMSARVKTGEEYANTRLNNAEFGQACRIAAVLGKLITPKYRPMILPFSQSKMAKMILEEIKTKTGNWGERDLGTGDVETLVRALNSTSKNDFESFGVFIDEDDQLFETDATLFDAKLQALGADGVEVSCASAVVGVGKWSASSGTYIVSLGRKNTAVRDFEGGGDDAALEVFPASYPALTHTSFKIYVLVVMPYRAINGVKHILQEACSFGVIASATQPA